MTQQLYGVARVDIVQSTNTWWEDSFQFGDVSDTSWNFSGKTFQLQIKAKPGVSGAILLDCNSGNGRIVVDDAAVRVLHMFVDDVTLRNALTPGGGGGDDGAYSYDLVMTITGTGERSPLMYGSFILVDGVTGD